MAIRDFYKLVNHLGGGGFDHAEPGVYLGIITSGSLSPVSVAANTSAEQALTFAGVQVGDIVLAIEKPTHQAGLTIVGGRVTAADTITVKFGNHTASPIVPTASEVYRAVVIKANR